MNTIKRPIATIVLTWLAMLGVDFFLHGGLLAGFYTEASPFLLTPLESFTRIPLGYAGFILFAGLLVWLLPRFEIANAREAFWFGAKLGAILWGGFVLGLISTSSIEFNLAIAWFLGQSVELGVGAVVVYKAATATSLRQITTSVVWLVVLAVVMAVVLQSSGLVPTIKIP